MAAMIILAATNVPAIPASIARNVMTQDRMLPAGLRRFNRIPHTYFIRITEARGCCFDPAQVAEFCLSGSITTIYDQL